MFFVNDTSIIIEEDDIFERILPNGVVEQFRVVDSGFHKGFNRIPDHYQTKVEKLTGVNRQPMQSVTYNITNESGKVNIHSVDNSTNITLSENDEKLFETLMTLAASVENCDDISENVKKMKAEAGKIGFASKYNDFIQSVANHMNIFAPFIPALTAFLVK